MTNFVIFLWSLQKRTFAFREQKSKDNLMRKENAERATSAEKGAGSHESDGAKPNPFKQQRPPFYISLRSTFPFSIVGGQR